MNIQNKRLIKLFRIFDENSHIITSEYISKIMNVSVRTVRNDLKELYDLLKISGAHIESKTNKGYKLIIDKSASYEKFRAELLEEYS